MVVEGKSILVRVSPLVQTAIYAINDQMGVATKILNALDDTKGTAALMSLTVIDKDKQNPDFDVLIFSEEPALTSADNAALSITDAEMSTKFIGRIRVSASDYVSTDVNSEATIKLIGLLMQGAPGSRDLWFVMQSQGAPTFTTTTPLVLGFGIIQD